MTRVSPLRFHLLAAVGLSLVASTARAEGDAPETKGDTKPEVASEQDAVARDKPSEPTTAAKDKPKITIGWDGYAKVIAEAIQNDPVSTFVGRNDGFRIGNARLGMSARYGDKLLAYVSLEASVAKAEDINAQNAELTVGPRDMFLAYDLVPQAAITFGRFKAPYDIGELESESARVFIDRPLESRGVLSTQGFQQPGMSQERQIGLMISRDRLGLTPDFDLGYALALTNGRTENLALNDNDRPAGFARLSLLYSTLVQLNLAGFTDTRTVGQLPNLFDEDVMGAEASVIVKVADLRIEGQVLYQHTDYTTSGTKSTSALGFHAQASYRLYGFELAYRFAYYDPLFSTDANDKHLYAVNEHTIGVSYFMESLPLRFSLNGTLAGEAAERRLENNRLAFLAQFNF